MSIDGAKVRQLREQRGISQEKLALMSHVNKRTVQRAEAGMAVALETAAFLADALSVKPEALRMSVAARGQGAGPTARSRIVLVPTVSGRRIVEAILFSFRSEITYDVEPTTENVELLSALATRLKGVQPDPWNPPWENPYPSGDEVLRIQADVNSYVAALGAFGVRVFLASYTADCVRPFLGEAGFMTVRKDQPSEPADVALVVVSDSAAGHLVRRPGDIHLNEIPS